MGATGTVRGGAMQGQEQGQVARGNMAGPDCSLHAVRLRRRWAALRSGVALIAVLALFVLALPGCSGLGGPQQLTLSLTDLYRALEKQLPIERPLLGVLQVRVDLPRLRLLPESQRLGAEFDVTVDDRLQGRTHRGVLGFESGLRYQASDQTVRLDAVRVQRLEFAALEGSAQPLLQRLGGAVVEQMLADLTVYRFTPGQLRAAERRGYAPSRVGVTAGGVVIELLPLGATPSSAPLR